MDNFKHLHESPKMPSESEQTIPTESEQTCGTKRPSTSKSPASKKPRTTPSTPRATKAQKEKVVVSEFFGTAPRPPVDPIKPKYKFPELRTEMIGSKMVLFVGDPHFKKDNVIETEAYAEETERVFANAPQGTICLLAGDILDNHGIIYIDPLGRAMRLIERLVKIGTVVLLVGNHDYMTNQEYLSDKHWMITLEPWAKLEPRLHIASKPIVVDNMVFSPYVPPGRLVEALDTCTPNWKSMDCVFAHQELRGVKLCGNHLSDKGDVWEENWPPIVSGHIHTAYATKNIIYPGSVIPHSFGESGSSAVFLVGVHPRASGVMPQLLECPVAVPRRRTVRLAYDDLIKDYDKSMLQVQPRDVLERVRVILTFTAMSDKNDRRIKSCLDSMGKNPRIKVVLREDERSVEDRQEYCGNLDIHMMEKISFRDILKNVCSTEDVKNYLDTIMSSDYDRNTAISNIC